MQTTAQKQVSSSTEPPPQVQLEPLADHSSLGTGSPDRHERSSRPSSPGSRATSPVRPPRRSRSRTRTRRPPHAAHVPPRSCDCEWSWCTAWTWRLEHRAVPALP